MSNKKCALEILWLAILAVIRILVPWCELFFEFGYELHTVPTRQIVTPTKRPTSLKSRAHFLKSTFFQQVF